jgi:hypothetical protein
MHISTIVMIILKLYRCFYVCEIFTDFVNIDIIGNI